MVGVVPLPIRRYQIPSVRVQEHRGDPSCMVLAVCADIMSQVGQSKVDN
jgi:hypothetical protein